jgi:drug/metabolite transporter (DMT)-like permease
LDRSRIKTRVLSAIVVVTNVLGNASLARGLKQAGSLALSPLLYLEVLFRPWVLLGIALLILWLLTRMTLLSWADLSYVLPVTSAGYVLTALAGRWFFGEHVTWQRWLGTLLITGGIALVGGTRPGTVKAASAGGGHSC